MFDAEIADGLAFFFGEDFADGVVWGVEHDHARTVSDGGFEFFHFERPVAGGGGLLVSVFGRVQRDVDDLAAWHLDIGDVLVEKGLEDDYFVARLDEAHEGGEHAFICASGDGYVLVGIQMVVEELLVGVCYCFL